MALLTLGTGKQGTGTARGFIAPASVPDLDAFPPDVTPAPIDATDSPPAPAVEPDVLRTGGVRDRDIRNAIRDALLATGAFDEVVLARQEDDYTTVGIESRKLIIEPFDQGMMYQSDYAAIENLMVDSRLKLSFLSRADDPQIRDERLEAMVNVAYNTMIGVCWLGLTFPAFTQFVQHAKWLPPKHPVRRADAIYSYRYEPSTTFDVTE